MRGSGTIRWAWVGVVVILCLMLAFEPAEAAKRKRKKQKYIPKTTIEHRALMFAPMEKRFFVNRKTPQSELDKISRIEKAVFVVDEGGKYPPKSLLSYLAQFNNDINLVWPIKFTRAHMRRLQTLAGEFEVTFRIGKDRFPDDLVNRALSLGPIRKVFEIDAPELTYAILKKLNRVRIFDLRLIVPDGRILDAGTLRILGKMKGVKEILIPEDYPPKEVNRLRRLKKTRILIRVKGVGPEVELVKSINNLKKIQTGAVVRGLMKKEEAFEYLLMDNLRLFEFYPEDWKISEEFIQLMNSKGGIQ